MTTAEPGCLADMAFALTEGVTGSIRFAKNKSGAAGTLSLRLGSAGGVTHGP